MAYEFLQNTALNANTFLLNATGQPRATSRLNQFGADLGGPILKNRMFFYGAYRAVRNQFPRIASLSQPSLAMRNGDFSALGSTQLYNPFTGAPFPNNQIPANLITPQAKALLGFLPTPTNLSSPGPSQYRAELHRAGPNNTSINGVDFRLDGQSRRRTRSTAYSTGRAEPRGSSLRAALLRTMETAPTTAIPVSRSAPPRRTSSVLPRSTNSGWPGSCTRPTTTARTPTSIPRPFSRNFRSSTMAACRRCR